MTSLPNPFTSAGVPHDAPPAETLPAVVSGTEHLAAGSVEISLSELCARGFDEEKFMFDIGFVPDNFQKYMALLDELIDDAPPLFLQRTG